MATPTRRSALLARGFLIALGGIAVGWGLFNFPAFWREATAERVAAKVLAGDQFDQETLHQQLATLTTTSPGGCRPAALRSAAIIRLRLTEIAAADNNGKADFQTLDQAIRSSLACAPADPFLWLALYKADASSDHPGDIGALHLSYELGPYEGWVALRRNPISFANYATLPPELKAAAIDEFVALVRSNFFAATADILIGPAWPERAAIVSRMTAGLPDEHRKLFADALQQRGYDFADLKRPNLSTPTSH